MHWVLAHDGVFLNTAGDMNLLPRILDAAARAPAAGADNHDTAAGEAAARRQMQPLFTAAQNVI